VKNVNNAFFYLKTKKRNKRLFPSMPVSRCILLLPHDAL